MKNSAFIIRKDSLYLRGKSKIILPLLAVCLVIYGCGIFDTRESEKPNTIRSTYIPPTTPELVIDNISFSVQEKNSDNYIKCVSPIGFQYVPDSKSQLIYGSLFVGWNSTSEKKYFDNLVGATEVTASSVLFLDNKNFTLISSDSATFNARYIIVFQHRISNIPKSAEGNVTMYLSTDENNLFYISRWEDYRINDTDFTWSELRANFSY